MNRKCAKCKEEKNTLDFHKNKSDKSGFHHYCKKCNSEQKKYGYINNPNYKLTSKKGFYKHIYNTTIEEVDLALKRQEYKCSICKNEIDLLNKTAVIDHNHTTGNFRSLLCYRCNTGLGQFKENIEYLKSAINYIEKFNK
jgi:hypothetical protein